MIRTLKAFTLHPASVSVGLVFSTMSLLFASWIARIPEIQARLGIGEGALGFTLLGLSIGALSITPFSGWLLNKMQTGTAVIFSSLITCGILPLIAFAPNVYVLAGVFVLLGMSNSFMNVAMNTAATAVEREHSVRIMSTCHGMYSLGGFVGAGSSGLMAAIGVPLEIHLTGLALLLTGMNLLLRPVLTSLPEGVRSGASFAMPSKALLGLCVIGFCIMMAEGAIADWSAIYLKNYLQSSAFAAGMGYAAFSFAMAGGRFYGDNIRHQFRPKKLVFAGSLTGAAGLTIAVVSPWAALAVLGFAIAGLGFSIVVPILFAEAAKAPGVSPGMGIATVVSAGTLGFLIGPPLIGMLGEVAGLGAGLTFVLLLTLAASCFAQKLK